MEPINWRDPPFDDGFRIIQTAEELSIPGLRMFGKHSVTKAIPALYPHFHENAFEITYLCKGTMTFINDDQIHHLSGGDVYISPPGEAHSTGAVPISLNEMYWFQLDITTQDFLHLDAEWKIQLISDLKNLNCRLINTNTGEMQKLMKEFHVLLQCNRYDTIPLINFSINHFSGKSLVFRQMKSLHIFHNWNDIFHSNTSGNLGQYGIGQPV